jgi:hypothetical protein
MSGEEQEDFLKAKQEKSKKILAEKAMKQEYEERIQEETLESFKDVPDEVKILNVVEVTNNQIKVCWEKPESNNFKIKGYKIYRSEVKTTTENFKLKCRAKDNHVVLSGLKGDTIYYL